MGQIRWGPFRLKNESDVLSITKEKKLINEAMKQRKRLRVLIVKKSVINDFGFSLLSSYELLSVTKMIPTHKHR